ncbi:MAG: CAP domain-containing protein [Planctomycetota bacterium]|jgi:uncharacterized protein YkwD
MRHRYLVVIIAVLALALASCSKKKSSSGGGGGPSPLPTGTGTTVNEAQYVQDVLNLVNQERANVGLGGLIWDDQVAAVADGHSNCMRDNSYFDHTCSYGHGASCGDRLSAGGVSYFAAGENIARGQTTPAAVMTAWMNSPGHRDNILNTSYTHIGVGLAMPGYYWTQNFIGK